MDVSPSEIISELLDQNSKLRLELAVLSSMKQKQDEIERQMKQSQNLTPEALEMISKLDIR